MLLISHWELTRSMLCGRVLINSRGLSFISLPLHASLSPWAQLRGLSTYQGPIGGRSRESSIPFLHSRSSVLLSPSDRTGVDSGALEGSKLLC